MDSLVIGWCRFLVHANVPFSVTGNWFFLNWLDKIRPSYTPASCYVLSHSILASEECQIQLDDIARLKDRKWLTFLIDGWEDKLKRSLYGTIAAEIYQFPVVLSLTDLTGHHASADKILEAAVQSLKMMELEDGRNFIAVTTDNPTVMQAFWQKFQDKYYWIISLPCFLHGINNIIGKICAHPQMKQVIAQATCIVSFFNNSHYWGGQLKEQARKDGIRRTLKQNCKTQWYALILQAISVNKHRNALTLVCVHPDAQCQIGGFTPVAKDVITTVLHDAEFWNAIGQLIKTAQPLVDAIGDCKSHDTSLADCMLTLIHCARTVSKLSLEDGDDASFWAHAQTVFNCCFHAMNTTIHSLALFLHPMCWKLAISQVASGHSFQFMVEAALKIAKQWRWNEALAISVVHNLKEYYKCSGVFAGGEADALAWWESLPISAEKCPLKLMAITIHSMVPHAADVEHYFSDLGGVQSHKRCGLTVETFQMLSKACVHYSYHLWKMDHAAGKSMHWKHAHMHTQPTPGIDTELAADLERTFSWVPPLAANTHDPDDYLAGPESITDEELVEAFVELEHEKAEACMSDVDQLDDGALSRVLDGGLYAWDELDHVDKGLAPRGFREEVTALKKASEGSTTWDIGSLTSSEGL
ncbi:hypothetical protein M404DRAFT_138850 [Pisolithus tinctorius Marx 270]|uniref:Uncharacterized protein n=1 Tax=Pisolithus tinctorius Marx 270 TaxID=870435 RepID=A0A0C3PEJ2_PISTI|nr:hypothetical protein M404DRAFT_138850 [Pisolithus tinctorius Marx 270]